MKKVLLLTIIGLVTLSNSAEAGCFTPELEDYSIITSRESLPTCISIFVEPQCSGSFEVRVGNRCGENYVYSDLDKISEVVATSGADTLLFDDLFDERKGVFYSIENPSIEYNVSFLIDWHKNYYSDSGNIIFKLYSVAFLAIAFVFVILLIRKKILSKNKKG
jgi:hypothetical protein